MKAISIFRGIIPSICVILGFSACSGAPSDGQGTAPSIRVTTPQAAGEPADASFRIEYQADDPDSDAVVSLYFDSDRTGEDGELIVSGLPEGVGQYDWNTHELAGGEYFVYGVARDESHTKSAYAPGSVVVQHQNMEPTITITEPNGVADTANESFRIEWIASDADSPATVSLYFDTDDFGIDGTLIVSGMAESATFYDWNTSGVPEGGYYIYGVIRDEESQAVDYGAGPVTVRHDYSGCFPAATACSQDGYGFHACGVDPNDPATNSYGNRIPCQAGVACRDGACQNTACFVPEIMILLDRSSSMQGARFAWVKQGLSRALRRFERQAYIGFRQFPEGSCAAGDVLPLALDQAAAIEAAIADPSVDASTPIVSTLTGLVPYYGDSNDGQAVILITDGVETCTEPDEAAGKASELFRSGVFVHTVAVTTQADITFLDRIALDGGTSKSRLVNDADGLFSALEAVFFRTHVCCAGLSIVTPALSAAGYGQPYLDWIQIQGGYPEVSLSIVSGRLPQGLSLDPATGEISGTPLEGGAFSFVVEAADSCLAGIQSVRRAYELQVTCDCASLQMVTSSLPDGLYGEPYQAAVQTQGGWGAVTFSLVSGSLPAGLSLDSATGAIAGTPRQEGAFDFTVRAADECPCGTQSAQRSYRLAVQCHCPQLSITTLSLPDAEYDVPYSQPILYSGGYGSVAWELASGSLPTGVVFDPASHTVRGTPLELGAFSFALRATDSCDCPSGRRSVERSLSLAVRVYCPGLSILTAWLPPGSVGDFYEQPIRTSGGYKQVAFQVVSGGLPPGLALDGSTGMLSGVPGGVGQFVFTVRAQDVCPAGVQAREATYTLEVCEYPQWVKAYLGSNSTALRGIRETQDGGFIAAGNLGQHSYGTGESDAWLVKLDRAGALEWQESFGGSGFDWAGSVDVVPGGGIVLGGTILYSITGYYRGAWIARLDGDGNLAWQKSYDSVDDAFYSPTNFSDQLMGVRALPGGGFLAAVEAYANDYSALVFRLDADGNPLWLTALASTTHDTIYDVEPAADGSFIAAGRTFFGRDRQDAWVVKLGANGAVQWQKTYGQNQYDDAAYAIRPTADGGYIFAGDFYVVAESSNDAWVVKLDAGGLIVWQKRFGSSLYDNASSIEQTTDGGYIVAGNTGSYNTGGWSIWVFKLDMNGNLVWQKSYGTRNYAYGASIRESSLGGYVVSGFIQTGSANIENAWVLRLDPDGNLCGGCPGGIGADTNAVARDTAVTAQDVAVPVSTTFRIVVNSTVFAPRAPGISVTDLCRR